MERYRVIDQESMLEGLDPMSHEIWQKPMEGTISFDVGEGKDYSVATLFENGEYRTIAVCDSISFADSVQRSSYVGVDMGECTLSPETANKMFEYLTGLREEHERLGDSLAKALKSWNECNGLMYWFIDRFKGMKHRKTTCRTIRRDCAKRNRHR